MWPVPQEKKSVAAEMNSVCGVPLLKRVFVAWHFSCLV